MENHEIIVFGGSAGSLKALTCIIGALPPGLPAAIFVAQHVQPNRPSALPKILSDAGPLTALHPADRDLIVLGRVYVAPPDHHLLVERGFVRVLRGPRENRFRPAVDVLFRSAARSFGASVVGIVLSGMLDDGTVGLQAIKRHGGVTVVQDPAEADYPDMPQSALRHALIDHVLPPAAIAELLTRLAGVAPGPAADDDRADDIEAALTEQQTAATELVQPIDTIGSRSFYTCPQCSGLLWQIGDAEPLHFRCHVGHAFTAAALLAEQTRSLENALWTAVRLMEEKVDFARRMAERRRRAALPEAAAPFEALAARIEGEIRVLRGLLFDGAATEQSPQDVD